MEKRNRRVVVGIDDPRVRGRVATILKRAGYDPQILDGSATLRAVAPTRDVLIVETRNDVAALSQIVYELYGSWQSKQALPIIALLSADALKRNPKVGWWDIDGHAALAALVILERANLEEELPPFIERLQPAA